MTEIVRTLLQPYYKFIFLNKKKENNVNVCTYIIRLRIIENLRISLTTNIHLVNLYAMQCSNLCSA